MTPSKEALERVVMALNDSIANTEDARDNTSDREMRKILDDNAELDRAAAKEIQDYLDGKEEQA